MYLSKNLYSPQATYVGFDDRQAFLMLLQSAEDALAKNLLSNVPVSEIKKSYSPVIYGTTKTKLTKEDHIINRTMLNPMLKRRFLKIDVDFEEDEEGKAKELIENCRRVSNLLNTWYLIYPTLSYPSKPRYRVIFFTKNLMDGRQYMGGMKWLFQILKLEITDKGDLYIQRPFNAPIFTTKSQLKGVEHNLDDDSLEAIDNKRFSRFVSKSKPKVYIQQIEGAYDSNDFFKLCQTIIDNGLANSYEDFWKVVSCFAKATLLERISYEMGKEAMIKFANISPNATIKTQWQHDNIKMYDDFIKRYDANREALIKVPNLEFYSSRYLSN